MAIRIILAEDHKLFRAGLRAILEQESDLEVIAEADNGRAAVELAAQLSPDVVIMDISMPDLNGMVACRQLTSRSPATRVIALSMHADRHFVEGMLQAGASGYLVKDCAPEELVRAIRTVAAGQTYLTPAVAGQVVADYVQQAADDGAVPRDLLTARELEILQLVAEGQASKQIAAALGVSVKTVETHRHQIMAKLNLHSVAELTKFAVRRGLTSLEP